MGEKPPEFPRTVVGQIRSGTVTACLGNGGGAGSFCREDDTRIPNPDPSVEQPLSAEWTDEKHSLYLNYMEYSFVKQLYNHRLAAVGLSSCHSDENTLTRERSHPTSCSSRQQFKVLQGGCWEKVNFAREGPEIDVVDELCDALKSPCITRCWYGREVSRRNYEAVHIRQRRSCSHLASCSHQALDYQAFVGSNAEVSDQNFVTGSREARKLGITRGVKRKKAK